MDLRQTEYVLMINEEKSIAKAAERLFVTQSALNQQLSKLEAELGTPLFERTRSAWKLTAAGEIYVRMGKEMLWMRKNAYEEIRDLADTQKREMHIGLIPERGVDMFTALYPRFHAAFPNVIFEPEEMNVLTIQKRISAGKLDLGLCTLESSQKDENTYNHMCTEEILLAVPSDLPELKAAMPHLASAVSHTSSAADVSHTSAATAGLQSEDSPILSVSDMIDDAALLQFFKNTPFILMRDTSTLHETELRLFRCAGFEPDGLFSTSSNLSKYRMVGAGMGCAFLPRTFACNNPAITYIQLPSHPSWEVTICTRKGAYISRAEEYFLTLCKRYWDEKIK